MTLQDFKDQVRHYTPLAVFIRPLCGADTIENVFYDKSQVTCKKCLKKMK